jgi:hypothetical protein
LKEGEQGRVKRENHPNVPTHHPASFWERRWAKLDRHPVWHFASLLNAATSRHTIVIGADSSFNAQIAIVDGIHLHILVTVRVLWHGVAKMMVSELTREMHGSRL